MPSELLHIQPGDLKFPFEVKKQISCSLRLVNVTDNYVAFKVKTTSPKKYCVRPNTGIVLPQASADVTVTMQAQREVPPDMVCKDKFLVQSVVAPSGMHSKDVNQELFNKEAGKEVHEAKLRVVYVSPPQPPSPVAESAEEGLSPKAGIAQNNGDFNSFAGNEVTPKDYFEIKAKLTEARAALTSLSEERNAAVQLTQRLQQDMTQLVANMDSRKHASKGSGDGTQSSLAVAQKQTGFPFFVVLLGILLGIFVGYLFA